MVEQERLELTSAVEAENYDELDDLAKSLDDVDTTLHRAGSTSDDELNINTEVRGVQGAVTELTELQTAINALDDETVVDVETDYDTLDEPTDIMRQGPDVSDTKVFQPDTVPSAADGGDIGDLFTIDNLDILEESVGESLTDTEALGLRGGEAGRVDDILDEDIEDIIDFEGAVEIARDSDSDIDTNTIQRALGMDGPDGFAVAIDKLRGEGLTDIDDTSLLESLGGAEQEFKDIRFTMGQFHDIIAALIPLAGVLIGAMPAAITGIVALGGAALAAAGALAGIGALGAMGVSLQQSGELSMEPINQMMADVGEAFVDAFAPLSKTFAPLIRNAATELETMMGPLATAASGLQMFTDEFQAVTQLAGNVLPSMVSLSLRFSDAVMPVLAGIGRFLVQKDIFGFMANQLATALPALVRIGLAFTEILPAVIRLSQGFLTFASFLFIGAQVMSLVINKMGILAPIIGGLISLYFGLVAASTLYTIATAASIKTIGRFALALAVKAIPAIKGAISSLAAYTGMSYAAATATAVLLSVVTLGAAAIGVMSAGWLELGSNIGSATKSLRQFARTSNGIGSTNLGANGSGFGSGDRAGFYQDNSTTVIQAGDKDSAARQQYASEYEKQQHVDSVFGS